MWPQVWPWIIHVNQAPWKSTKTLVWWVETCLEILSKNPEMRRINYFRCLNESCGQRWRWREGYKHTLIADKTQILNNLGYISKTVNRNSQNKKHFTYITQFTRHLRLTREPRGNYSNHGKKQWYTVKITKHSTKLVLICHSLNYLSP